MVRKEEEVWPNTNETDPDGTYTIGEDGTIQPLEEANSEPEEDESEQLLPEDDHYNFIFRRSFHSTPRNKKSDQRENIF